MNIFEDYQALVQDIHARTLQRWKASLGLASGDGRPAAVPPILEQALSEAERHQPVKIANEPRCPNVSSARFMPVLADEVMYLACESTFARVLWARRKNAHGCRVKAPETVQAPTTCIASAPRQLWYWDRPYLSANTLGRRFHRYRILGFYSPNIVGWGRCKAAAAPSTPRIWRAARRSLLEGIVALGTRLALHADRASHSRPPRC